MRNRLVVAMGVLLAAVFSPAVNPAPLIAGEPIDDGIAEEGGESGVRQTADPVDVIVPDGLTIEEADIQLVLQIAADLDDAWNSRDAKAFAALFDDYADFQLHTGLLIQGKAAIEKFWAEQVFPGVPDPMRHEITPKMIRFTSEKAAIGDGMLKISMNTDKGEMVHLESGGTMLLIKKEDRWLIAAIRLIVFAKE